MSSFTPKCSVCELEYRHESDHYLCFLIRHTSVNTGIPFAETTGETGRTMDPAELSKRVKTRNILRQCAPAEAGKDDAVAIEEWTRFKGKDALLPNLRPMPPRLVYTLVGGAAGGSGPGVLQQLESHMDVMSVTGVPTPMKQLCEELRAAPARSILDVLYKNYYSSEHAISMGVEFNMITTCADDWEVILTRKFFTPDQLYQLGFTFTRMLLAGMDLDLFSYAGMDYKALHIIRFSMRAFKCARGTKEQLGRILGTGPPEGSLNEYAF